MTKVKVGAFSVSLDGFGAGLGQTRENPIGANGFQLMGWFFNTKVFQEMHGGTGGETGVDNDFAERAKTGLGAWILGRNMFGPIRGPWKDDSWKGWWGDNPPYHVPVFVLTHQARAPIEMKGGTTFYFVTDGIESALKKARDAAKGKAVRIGGGVSTIRQYLKAGLIDEMHLAVSPVILGQGEPLFHGLDLPALGFKVTQSTQGEGATHVILKRV